MSIFDSKSKNKIHVPFIVKGIIYISVPFLKRHKVGYDECIYCAGFDGEDNNICRVLASLDIICSDGWRQDGQEVMFKKIRKVKRVRRS